MLSGEEPDVPDVLSAVPSGLARSYVDHRYAQIRAFPNADARVPDESPSVVKQAQKVRRRKAVIEGADIDVVDVEQQPAAGAARQLGQEFPFRHLGIVELDVGRDVFQHDGAAEKILHQLHAVDDVIERFRDLVQGLVTMVPEPGSILLLVGLCVLSNKAQEVPQRALELPPGKGNPRNSEGAFATLRDGRILFVYTHYTAGKGGDHDPAHLAHGQGRTAVRSHDGPRPVPGQRHGDSRRLGGARIRQLGSPGREDRPDRQSDALI